MGPKNEGMSFLGAALRSPRQVATPWPTSRALAERLLEGTESGARVVELGPGAGAITAVILERVMPERYLGLEINPGLARVLGSRFPGARVENCAAQELNRLVAPGSVDQVVASLPWTFFSVEAQLRTLAAVRRALRPGGVFRTYVCVHALAMPSARGFLRRLEEIFPRPEPGPVEWRNLPPARVWTAWAPAPGRGAAIPFVGHGA